MNAPVNPKPRDGEAARVRMEAARADAQLFVSRLLAVAERGNELGDPRIGGTIAAWAEICEGIPDQILKHIIPGSIRLLFRRSDTAAKLTRCGLRDSVTLQHEAIAPYVVAFRRMRAIRNGGELSPNAMLAETRKELRELNARFHSALDQAISLQEENVRLQKELTEAKEREQEARDAAKAGKREAAIAYNKVEDTAARALTKLKYALDALREAMERRTNDPNSMVVAQASMTVQSYYMVLEDLGKGEAALKLAQKILGDKLSAAF